MGVRFVQRLVTSTTGEKSANLIMLKMIINFIKG